MIYYKTIDDDGFVSVSTVNADGEGNITKEVYDELLTAIQSAPDGYGLKDNGEYAKLPDAEPTSDEILDILLGGSVE